MNQLFQVKDIHEGNKGLFAKKSLQRTQQVMQCEPIAWATLQSAKSKNCNWCLLQKQLVKCSQCKCFYYCSKQCQQKDWKYHKQECNMYAKMCTEKKLSIHKEISTQFVLNVRLYIVLQQNKQLAERFNSMCSMDDYQPLDRRQHFQELSLVMMENMGMEKNETNMSRLIKQFNIVAVNAFTIQDLFYTTDGVAVGIFWPANSLNHACNANCTQVFDGRYLKILTNTKVEQGQELTISYTTVLQLQKNRSKFLKENYFFDCFCELCHVQKMINSQFAYIKCPNCKQANIRKVSSSHTQNQPQQNNQNGLNQDKSPSQNKKVQYQCTSCKNTVDSKLLAVMALKIQSLPERIEGLKSYKQKKQQLLSCKKQFDLKHPSFYTALESVYLSAIDQGLISDKDQQMKKYFSQGNILLNEIIKNLPKWYKIDQEELINIRFFSKFNEMSKLAYNMSKLTKCLQYLEKAKKCIQKINLKNNYKDIEELRKRYEEVKIEMSIAKTKVMK